MATKSKEKALLVTTAHRGVFFGYAASAAKDKKITLARARNCVYWAASVRGVFGLAVSGPNGQCKIGPQMPSIDLEDVTATTECTAEAVAAWEKAPWG